MRSASAQPFADERFVTVAFIACLNHLPERRDALREARRVLKPGGRVVATMIGRVIGWVGHKIWWYSEDKHRAMDPGERWGLSSAELRGMIEDAGLRIERTESFVYGLNILYVAVK
jgi:ubiquinone/menaquinone biosynthesis C-methylase UbiE